MLIRAITTNTIAVDWSQRIHIHTRARSLTHQSGSHLLAIKYTRTVKFAYTSTTFKIYLLNRVDHRPRPRHSFGLYRGDGTGLRFAVSAPPTLAYIPTKIGIDCCHRCCCCFWCDIEIEHRPTKHAPGLIDHCNQQLEVNRKRQLWLHFPY